MLELKIGEFFAGCRILCICGTGGFGTVYLAENAAGRRVALKIVSSANQEKELRGIRLYMDSAAQSPYLLSIHHVGIERGELFYIMEAADPLAADSAVYIADTLGMRLKSRGRIDPGEALEIVRESGLNDAERAAYDGFWDRVSIEATKKAYMDKAITERDAAVAERDAAVEKLRQTARNLKAMNLTNEQIAAATGLSAAEIAVL